VFPKECFCREYFWNVKTKQVVKIVIMLSKKWQRISLGLYFLPVFVFFVGYCASYYFIQTITCIVPDVVGKDFQKGVFLLSDKHLNVRLLREKEDVLLPEGTIIHQIPFSGSVVRPNQNVFVTVSKKPLSQYAPNFLDNTYADLLVQKTARNVNVRAIWLEGNHEKNKCFAQTPRPSDEMFDKKIRAYLSSGQNKLYIVPDFRELSLKLVQDYLERLNIHIEVFGKYKESSDYCGDVYLFDYKIVDQKPMPGSIVDFGKNLYMQLQVIKA